MLPLLTANLRLIARDLGYLATLSRCCLYAQSTVKTSAEELFAFKKDELETVCAIYEKQCPKLYNNTWEADEGFLTIMVVGRKYNFDYLLHLVDDFNRWRIKNQDKTDHTNQW
eukprot:1012282_1